MGYTQPKYPMDSEDKLMGYNLMMDGLCNPNVRIRYSKRLGRLVEEPVRKMHQSTKPKPRKKRREG